MRLLIIQTYRLLDENVEKLDVSGTTDETVVKQGIKTDNKPKTRKDLFI